jgi:circadian clock protein KaiB
MKIQEDGNGTTYELQLFVTGASPNSVRAIANTRRICEEYLGSNYNLTIIDVYQQPLAAREQQLIALPMLLKSHPPPVMRLIGDMSDVNKVLKGLGIPNDGINGTTENI